MNVSFNSIPTPSYTKLFVTGRKAPKLRYFIVDYM
jgi:hypothetical protein